MSYRHSVLLAGVVAMGLGASALASNRPFTYTYTIYPAPAGQFEFEQWVEYKGNTQDDAQHNEWKFREEFEYAVSDKLSLALYLPSWHYQESRDGSQTRFDTVGLEAIYYLTNPIIDPIGVGLYAETKVGDEEAAAEAKLLLQKDIGNWVFAYNLILETEVQRPWESQKEVEGVLGHSFGAAYSVTPSLRLGTELVIESEYLEWRNYEETTVYAGPSIAYQGGKFFGSSINWWTALSPLFQVTQIDDQPDFKARLIFGLEF